MDDLMLCQGKETYFLTHILKDIALDKIKFSQKEIIYYLEKELEKEKNLEKPFMNLEKIISRVKYEMRYIR